MVQEITTGLPVIRPRDDETEIKEERKKTPREAGLSLGSLLEVFLEVAAGTRRVATELGAAGSAQRGRTVRTAIRIAVVRLELELPLIAHAAVRIAIVMDVRHMTLGLRKRARAGEGEYGD
jgi:hypothetical protein